MLVRQSQVFYELGTGLSLLSLSKSERNSPSAVSNIASGDFALLRQHICNWKIHIRHQGTAHCLSEESSLPVPNNLSRCQQHDWGEEKKSCHLWIEIKSRTPEIGFHSTQSCRAKGRHRGPSALHAKMQTPFV